MTRSFLVLVTLALLVQSCGYTLAGRGSALPDDIHTVAIPMFGNRTGEPDIDTTITNSVRNRFIQDGRLKVTGAGSSDSELTGVISSYGLRPLAYDTNNNVTEYMVTLTADVTFRSVRADRSLFKQKVVTNERYSVDSSITATESQRLAAIRYASDRLAESIVSLVIEAF